MSMKPILFSGPMVRAILEKQNPKTQTRRVAQTKGASVCDSAPLQDLNWCGDVVDDASHLFEHGDVYLKVPDAGTETRHRVFPKYKKSDILWVRETWREWDESDEIDDDPEEFREWRPRTDPLPACMRADCGELEEEQREAGLKWRPSIFMPKWACRLFLEVENIRAERVANLTTSDAYAEGVAHYVRTAEFKGLNINSKPAGAHSSVMAFYQLWNSINAKRGFGWDENPWVWVYEFKRTLKPANWPTV